MAKVRKEYDAEGVKLTMRTRDYLADMSGQLALGIMGNLVGQMTYFYTDKVGMAVGAVGVVMAIAKIIDAFTDVIFGNIIDHSRGGNKKYFRWMIALAIPAAAIVALMFTVPKNVASGVQVAYALVTNLLLTAVIYTMIATPFSAVMVVRTKSNSERSSMGVFRAVGNYGAGMIIAIATIPVTNMLGGTQDAWIKYGVVLALAVLLLFMICWLNGHKAAFTRENADENGGPAVPEEEPVPFGPAMSMLFKNKYWVIVLLFNLITAITNGIVGSAGTYYCKWIFGNDNLVALLGAVGLVATVIGFILSKPIISKLGAAHLDEHGQVYAGNNAIVFIADNQTASCVVGAATKQVIQEQHAILTIKAFDDFFILSHHIIRTFTRNQCNRSYIFLLTADHFAGTNQFFSEDTVRTNNNTKHSLYLLKISPKLTFMVEFERFWLFLPYAPI